MRHKTRKKKSNLLGGKAIASGGFGCVFYPALKCNKKMSVTSKVIRNKKTIKLDTRISKLMTIKHAKQEYNEIEWIRQLLSDIPNYSHYFILNDITMCTPAPLSSEDMDRVNTTCDHLLDRRHIRAEQLNAHLDDFSIISMPYGGKTVKYVGNSIQSWNKLVVSLHTLLIRGIVPMNQRNVFHNDIKDSNLLVDEKYTIRLVDWGLSCRYTPFKNNPIPDSWTERPLQFNVPFSVILFTRLFKTSLASFKRKHHSFTQEAIYQFIRTYLKQWMKKRGNGHYSFINEIITMLFEHTLPFSEISSSHKRREAIEKNMTVPIIIKYIASIVSTFLLTEKNKNGGEDGIVHYLDNVFIKNMDIWGFIISFVPLLELLSGSYSTLTATELELFNQLQYIFTHFLFNYDTKPIPINELVDSINFMKKILHKI
jgi:serine/threonine protein kinase